ncbi:MAG: hypothetical protein HC772_07185 [Leptolyngbyaceae cyanobacterium CRU_2_3]|nr:hypothetical protein [Leptolyngbyaceae cyanobacterium CRU_2_3]
MLAESETLDQAIQQADADADADESPEANAEGDTEDDTATSDRPALIKSQALASDAPESTRKHRKR